MPTMARVVPAIVEASLAVAEILGLYIDVIGGSVLERPFRSASGLFELTCRRRAEMTNRTWTVAASEAGQMLDKFLAAPDRLTSRSKAAAARERGKVFVNGGEAGPADVRLRLKAGDNVRVWEDRPGSSQRRPAPFKSGPLHILYEDQHLIVLNKPAGLLAVPLERRGEETSIFD